MEGKGTKLICNHCGKEYELTEYGYLEATDGDGKFDHVPYWYRWGRECVRQEILDGTYHLEVPVDICMMVNMKSISFWSQRLWISSEEFVNVMISMF
jgi:hypothetical protein